MGELLNNMLIIEILLYIIHNIIWIGNGYLIILLSIIYLEISMIGITINYK